MEVHGLQSTSDENWKDAKVHYWVTTDLIRGNGQQRGYFINEHPGGDRDCGNIRRYHLLQHQWPNHARRNVEIHSRNGQILRYFGRWQI